MKSRPIIAVVEWNTDKGAEPLVFVADDEPGARRAVLENLLPHLPTEQHPSEVNYVDLEWLGENPVPDPDDAEAVEAWLKAFKDQTTDYWLTLYKPASGEGRAPDEYIDKRTPTPRVQIVHSRHPDSECGHTVFVDDVRWTAEIEDIDPGRGWTRSEWNERIRDWEGDKTSFGQAVRSELEQASDSQYITD